MIRPSLENIFVLSVSNLFDWLTYQLADIEPNCKSPNEIYKTTFSQMTLASPIDIYPNERYHKNDLSHRYDTCQFQSRQ